MMLTKTEARWLACRAITLLPLSRIKAVHITQTRTGSALTIKIHCSPLNSQEMEEGESFIFTKEELA